MRDSGRAPGGIAFAGEPAAAEGRAGMRRRHELADPAVAAGQAGDAIAGREMAVICRNVCIREQLADDCASENSGG